MNNDPLYPSLLILRAATNLSQLGLLMQLRRVAAVALSLGVVAFALVSPAAAFAPSLLPAQRSALPSLCRTHATRPAVTGLRLKTEREDGSTEEQVAEAYKVYEKLMSTSNDGKGYWMDSPFQFFDNIKQAVERNFGDNKSPLTMFDEKPSNAIDLGDSPFSPLVSVGDVDEVTESSEEEVSTDAAFPVEGELAVTGGGKKKKGKKRAKKGKKGSLADAKAEAAALKAQLEADD